MKLTREQSKEFLNDLTELAEDVEKEIIDSIVEVERKSTLIVLGDVIKTSIVSLNAHAQNWPVSDNCYNMILGTALKLNDEIINTAKNNKKLEGVETAAQMLGIRMDGYFSGTGVLMW
jgi:hypothetical protein